MQQNNRIYGLDALRAIAMLLGMVLHASIAYKMFPNPSWPSDNQFHSYVFDGGYLLIHSFRMQLFYIVAGFFARLLYLKIGEKAFIHHRIKRIVIPFVASLLLILPFTITPFLYYKYFIAEQLPAPQAWASLQTQLLHWNGTAHLWFLYYLIIFYCFMLLVLRLKQVLKLQNGFRLSLNAGSLLHVVTVGLGLAVIQIVFCKEPIVEVSSSIFPKISHLTYYGYFFLLGYLLHRNSHQLSDISRNTWYYLTIGVLLTIGLYRIVILQHDSYQDGAWYFLWLLKLAIAFQSTFLAFGMMGFFLRYLNAASPRLKYIADASYWLYLVHLSMVAGLQILFLYTTVPGWMRFWLILVITTIVTLCTYEWFIRYTIIGDILHGPRTREKEKERKTMTA